MVRYDPSEVVTFDVLRRELAQQAAQQAEVVAKLMDEKIQLAQKNTMEQFSTTMKQQAAIKKHEKIEMLTQEYQALEATLHCQHPGDDSDAVRRTMEQIKRQYNTRVSQFQRNHADTELNTPPLLV